MLYLNGRTAQLTTGRYHDFISTFKLIEISKDFPINVIVCRQNHIAWLAD